MTIRHDGSPPTAEPASATKEPKDSQLESKEPTKHMEVGEAKENEKARPQGGAQPRKTLPRPVSRGPKLKVEDALAYIAKVKMEFGGDKNGHIYNQFLDIMKSFKAHEVDTPGVIKQVGQGGHADARVRPGARPRPVCARGGAGRGQSCAAARERRAAGREGRVRRRSRFEKSTIYGLRRRGEDLLRVERSRGWRSEPGGGLRRY